MTTELERRDQSVTYGAAYASIYDQLFPHDNQARATADTLAVIARRGSPGGDVPTAVELGVGTGRIAIPLAARGCAVMGIDSSPELLQRASDEQIDNLVLVHDDARTWRGAHDADLAYCVCATISMFDTRAEQRDVLRAARSAIHVAGSVVIETHSPTAIRRAHAGAQNLNYSAKLPSGKSTRNRSTLTQRDTWALTITWQDDGVERSASEFSQLTSPEQLAELARDVGLIEIDRWSTWAGEPYQPALPMYVSVFRATSPDPKLHPVPEEEPCPRRTSSPS